LRARGILRVSAQDYQQKDESVFKDGDFTEFKDCHLVPVEEAWRELLDFVITQRNRIALIQAPPRSGKSFLGELGSRSVPAGPWGEVEVRYCENVGDPATLAQLVAQGGYADVKAMATDSARSGEDASRPTIIYYFDEAHGLPTSIVGAFVKSGSVNGYAIFATAGRATLSTGYITPPELVARTLFYRSPARMTTVRDWLQAKFAALLLKGTEAEAAADLLLNAAAGSVGIITFVGTKLEESNRTDLQSVREELQGLLFEHKYMYIRIFGTANGKPNAAQAVLISALRCSGSLTKTSATGQKLPLWDAEDVAHRRGLSQAYYAAPAAKRDLSRCFVPVSTETDISFVHPLQPEIYTSKFTFAWTGIGLQDRWITNFARSGSEPAETPTTVLDLVLSWLSHVEIKVLTWTHNSNVDAPEVKFQDSLHSFCTYTLKLNNVKREQRAGRGYLVMFIEGSMGVELLIRASKSQGNQIDATGLLTNSATKSSLIEHAERGSSIYQDIAQQCSKGYITVLPATLVQTTADEEWDNFQGLVRNELAQLEYPVLVAVAPFGWAEWDVFLHRPGQEPVRLQVPRQQLMFKLIDDVPGNELVSARQFYPKPQEVWVQRLTQDMRLTGRAFIINPAPDNIAELAKAVTEAERLTCPVSMLAIYRQNWEGEWEEEEEDQVLFENTKTEPYGFTPD
jgi:hypothetical protein